MKNSDVIELTQGILKCNWFDQFKKGCPLINFERVFDGAELLEHFKKWQHNPSASKEDILQMAQKGVPLNIYRKEVSRIYFLISGSDIVYIGRSINIASRLYTHITKGNKDFDAITLLDVGGPDELTSHEWPYIAKFMPKYNFPKKTPPIIKEMHELLHVQKIDMVKLIEERIANTPKN